MIPTSYDNTLNALYSPAASQYQTINAEDTNKTTVLDDYQSLGKDDFLKLLIAELQNQDPLNPTDNTEFVAQLAQFSSLEQLTQMNTNLEDGLLANQAIAQAVGNAAIINYFGKTVEAKSGDFTYNGSGDRELTFQSSGDATGTLVITNADGDTVASFVLDGIKKDGNTVTWDGRTEDGARAAAGDYSYSIKAYDLLDNEVTATPIITGTVKAIQYRDGEVYVQVDDVLVPFNSIVGILSDPEQ